MYAVFKTGGKQYRGKIGDRLHIEKIDVTEGNIFNFEPVSYTHLRAHET